MFTHPERLRPSAASVIAGKACRRIGDFILMTSVLAVDVQTRKTRSGMKQPERVP